MAKIKKNKIYRPEFEIEYKNIFGIAFAILCILKVGIRRARLKFTIGNKVVAEQKAYIIPKYTFKKAVNK